MTDRQRGEVEYHREHARLHQNERELPVTMDVVTSEHRRWWNAYWSAYDVLRGYDLRHKRVLVPGCGFGEDAVRISRMGAEVYAFDISPEIIEIAKDRAARFNYSGVRFAVMPSEELAYENEFFDFVFCINILHHVDIPEAVGEFKRVCKKGARIIGSEPYTHGHIERLVRKNFFVDKILYPRMRKYIYGTDQPYLTEDEHKIDHKELGIVRNITEDCGIEYFDIFVSRIFPNHSTFIAKIDRTLARGIGGLGQILAGRIVFDGVIRTRI